jgi:hypothetical protein
MKHAMLNSVAAISGNHVSRQRDLQLQSLVLMPFLRLLYREAIDERKLPRFNGCPWG